MRLTVIWERLALDALAEIWMDALDRDAVRMAAAKIDAELSDQTDPKGVELAEGLRTIVVPPLVCVFHLEVEDRIVLVDAIRRCRDA